MAHTSKTGSPSIIKYPHSVLGYITNNIFFPFSSSSSTHVTTKIQCSQLFTAHLQIELENSSYLTQPVNSPITISSSICFLPTLSCPTHLIHWLSQPTQYLSFSCPNVYPFSYLYFCLQISPFRWKEKMDIGRNCRFTGYDGEIFFNRFFCKKKSQQKIA